MTGGMLERISEYFYDPVVFWTAPFILVALYAAFNGARAWVRRRRRAAVPHD